MKQLVLAIAGLALVGSMLLGCAKQDEFADLTVTEPAERQVDIVSAEGVVTPRKSADLAFKVSGRVEELLVQEGQAVTVGTELVRLDTGDLEQSVLQATAALESAQAELAKAEAGARVEEIAAAEAAVSAAQAQVTTAKLATEIAKANVTSAEGVLAETLAGVSASEQSVVIAQGNLAAAQATLTATQARLEQVQMGASEEELSIAEKKIEQAKTQLWAYQSERDAVGGFDDESAEYHGAEAQVAVGELAITIAQLQYDELAKGATEQELTIARADVAQAQANVNTQAALVEQARADLLSVNAQVTQAEASLAIAQAQLEQSNADVQSAQAAAQQAQSELDLLSAGTRSEDLAVARASVSSAEAGLVEAQNALDDAVLRAPFDGTVGEILIDQGELVVPQATVVRFGDLSVLQIETTDLSEVDINEVKVGQEATASIDALDGDTVTGTVASIGTIAGDERGDTVYKVIIALQPDDTTALRWGMSAFVEIKVR